MLEIFTELELTEETWGNLSKKASWNRKIRGDRIEVFIVNYATGISEILIKNLHFTRSFDHFKP